MPGIMPGPKTREMTKTGPLLSISSCKTPPFLLLLCLIKANNHFSLYSLLYPVIFPF